MIRLEALRPTLALGNLLTLRPAECKNQVLKLADFDTPEGDAVIVILQ